MQVQSATADKIIIKLNDNRGEVTVTVTRKTTLSPVGNYSGQWAPRTDWAITKIMTPNKETNWLQSHHMNNVYRLVKCVLYIKTQAA